MRRKSSIQKSFGSKLFLSLFITNFIFISLIVAVYCVYTWENGVEQKEKYYVESVRRMKVQLDEVIKEMDVVACQIAASTDIQKILKDASSPEYEGKNYFFYNLSAKRDAQKILWLFNSPVKRVHSINILSSSSLLGLNAMVDTIEIAEDFSGDEWQIKAKEYVVKTPHMDQWTGRKEDVVISLVRTVVRTSVPFEPVGYVEIQQPYTMMESICQLEGQQDGERIFIVDEEGEVIYPYGESGNYKELLKENDEEKIFGYGSKDSMREMGIYTKMEKAHWNVLLMQNRDTFFREIRFVLLLCFGIYLVLMVAATLIIFAASRWISTPVRELTKAVQGVTLENVSGLENVDVKVKEFHILQNAFIQMANQLRESAVKLSVANESALRLKIDQLQSKINPHFLYNSLTAIGTAGIEGGCDSVENMCFQLSELYRYVSEDGPDIVTLQEEITHVNMYLSFMKYRYEDAFLYDSFVEGELENINLCKLVFQPIVENCFQHGFRAIQQPFVIHMECIADENSWHFIVQDNGCGFDEKVLQKIKLQIELIDNIFATGKNYQYLQTENMALINIYIRLKFLYRNKVVLRIENQSDGRGAKVSVIYGKV